MSLGRYRLTHILRRGWGILHRIRRNPGLLSFRTAGRFIGRSVRHSPLSLLRLQIGACTEEHVGELNRQAETADADWLLLVPENARDDRSLTTAFAETVRTRPDADVIYADEVYASPGQGGKGVSLKPEFNPELLLSYNYIGYPALIRRRCFCALGGLMPAFGAAADHDLWLRAWVAGLHFIRIPQVLIHAPGISKRATLGETTRVVEEFCQQNRPDLVALPGRVAGTVQVKGRFDEFPAVTLVVPTCQSRVGDGGLPAEDPSLPHVLYMLDSLSKSSWPMDKLTVLVGDDKEDGSVYLNRDWDFELQRLYTPRSAGEPFHYARKMNNMWKKVATEAIVLINDDVRVSSPGWLEALLTFSLDPDVGGVGARLVFPDGRLQHAGIVGGPFGTAVHAWFGDPADKPTYQDWGLVHRDWSMVTGAVFATRRSVLEQVAGFDEAFALEFNDLDLCLRLGLLGYRIVYTPHAELIHFEKASRGPADTPAHELARFRRRWGGLIADDPAYHPGLSRDRYCITVSTH